MRKSLLVLAACAMVSASASAQDYAVKTNALLWATASINAAFEAGLSRQMTLEVGGSYNPWTFEDNKKIKYWFVQPELRYWTCERFNRGFFGFHLLGGQMNVGHVKFPLDIYPSVENYRYEGWAAGAGVSYGWDWRLSPHLNLEAAAGVGYVHVKYTRYLCPECGEKIDTGRKNYLGPTKLGVSLSYLF